MKQPEAISVGDVVCLEEDAKQHSCGLVLANGKCIFKNGSVFETKSLNLTKKRFAKSLNVKDVSDIVGAVGTPDEAKLLTKAKISGEELDEMDADWLEDIGITRKLRKRNLPTSIRTRLEQMASDVRLSEKKCKERLKSIWDEIERKRVEAENEIKRKKVEAANEIERKRRKKLRTVSRS